MHPRSHKECAKFPLSAPESVSEKERLHRIKFMDGSHEFTYNNIIITWWSEIKKKGKKWQRQRRNFRHHLLDGYSSHLIHSGVCANNVASRKIHLMKFNYDIQRTVIKNSSVITASSTVIIALCCKCEFHWKWRAKRVKNKSHSVHIRAEKIRMSHKNIFAWCKWWQSDDEK